MQAKDKQEKLPYEPPKIIYEGTITTRAGSGGPGKQEVLDPEKLFGPS